MSSDLDDYFERLDTLKQFNRELIEYYHSHEVRILGQWDPTIIRNEPRVATSPDEYGVFRPPIQPRGGWVPPNWLQKKAIVKDRQVWHEAQLDKLWERKSEFGSMAEFWRQISVIASRCSRPEESEKFRRKHLEIVAEQEKEASRLLDEIRVALEAVIPPYEKVLAAFYSAGGHGVSFSLDYRWPIDGNTSITLLRDLFGWWSRRGTHGYTWVRRYGTSGGREIPSGVKPNMISPQGVQYLLRGRRINSLRRVEVARLLHSKIPFLINRLKRCLAFRMIGKDAMRGRGPTDEENIGGWAKRLQKKFTVFKEIDVDLMYNLVERSYLKMTLPGIHAMAVDPSLAPTEESIEEELYFRVLVELYFERFSRRMVKWRYGIDMNGYEWAEYAEDNLSEGLREAEMDGLDAAEVNSDLIDAYVDMRIEKIDMLKLNKKHGKLEPDNSFHWVLNLEDDFAHLKRNDIHFRVIDELGIENALWSRKWYAFCSVDGPRRRLRNYLWWAKSRDDDDFEENNVGIGIAWNLSHWRLKHGGLRIAYNEADAYIDRAKKLLGIRKNLMPIEKPLERFDAILGPYLEIESKVSGLVAHMMDECDLKGNGYSSETLDMVRKILDGKMGEEEGQLLTALCHGETPGGQDFDTDTLHEWVERWGLLDHPVALGEILNGADFEAIMVKHGVHQ